jgi:hypothetical protein
MTETDPPSDRPVQLAAIISPGPLTRAMDAYVDALVRISHATVATFRCKIDFFWGGCLCVGCLEKRLGRRLKANDFRRHDPINHPSLPGTERLLKRRK